MRLAPIIATMAYLAVATGVAHAQSLLDFSYQAGNGEILSGVLSGTDAGNYFTATGLDALFVDGINVLGDVPNPEIVSSDTVSGVGEGFNGDGTAVVTLDGSYLDIFVSPFNGNGFVFGYNDVSNFGSFFILGQYTYSGAFTPSDWSATLVPEPAGMTVFALGLAGFMAARRRRA